MRIDCRDSATWLNYSDLRKLPVVSRLRSWQSQLGFIHDSDLTIDYLRNLGEAPGVQPILSDLVTQRMQSLREIWLDRKADHSSQPSSLELFRQEAKRWELAELPFYKMERPSDSETMVDQGPMCPLRFSSRISASLDSGPEARTLASSEPSKGWSSSPPFFCSLSKLS